MTASSTFQTVESAMSAANSPDSSAKACSYQISAPPGIYRDGAEIVIQPTAINLVAMFVWSGTSKRNVTTYVEGNGTVGVGAPLRLPAENGVVVSIRNAQTGPGGTLVGSFEYKIEGTEYNSLEL